MDARGIVGRSERGLQTRHIMPCSRVPAEQTISPSAEYL